MQELKKRHAIRENKKKQDIDYNSFAQRCTRKAKDYG